ncbi:unnamed protein product [Rangifer tarandus platyrhynchus]|uniref:Uncharacterized protein n=1 Tax=Rangifer tarandus platyrhynchus TaxID=3082113 RepID=A0AC60A2A7_RANTA
MHTPPPPTHTGPPVPRSALHCLQSRGSLCTPSKGEHASFVLCWPLFKECELHTRPLTRPGVYSGRRDAPGGERPPILGESGRVACGSKSPPSCRHLGFCLQHHWAFARHMGIRKSKMPFSSIISF